MPNSSGAVVAGLAVNLGGCLLLGALMRTGERTAVLGPGAFLALTTGLMGGFTTYSTFNLELLRSLEHGSWRLAAVNAAAEARINIFIGFPAFRTLVAPDPGTELNFVFFDILQAAAIIKPGTPHGKAKCGWTAAFHGRSPSYIMQTGPVCLHCSK